MGQLKRNNFSKQFKRMKYCKLILNGFQHEVNEAKHNWIVSRNGKIQISSYSFCLNFIYSFYTKIRFIYDCSSISGIVIIIKLLFLKSILLHHHYFKGLH